MITITKFDALSHYETVCRWWRAHNWPEIPLTSLPETGAVAFAHDKPVCAGWLYRTDSDLAWMEWLVMDPRATRDTRSLALDALIDALSLYAAAEGFRVVFTSVRSLPLIARLKRHRFIESDQHMTNLVRTN